MIIINKAVDKFFVDNFQWTAIQYSMKRQLLFKIYSEIYSKLYRHFTEHTAQE
jgi:hypothetical protein